MFLLENNSNNITAETSVSERQKPDFCFEIKKILNCSTKHVILGSSKSISQENFLSWLIGMLIRKVERMSD